VRGAAGLRGGGAAVMVVVVQRWWCSAWWWWCLSARCWRSRHPATLDVSCRATTTVQLHAAAWPRRRSQIIEVILNAPYHATKAALPAMIDAGWGRIVNTGTPQALQLPLLGSRRCMWSSAAGLLASCLPACLSVCRRCCYLLVLDGCLHAACAVRTSWCSPGELASVLLSPSTAHQPVDHSGSMLLYLLPACKHHHSLPPHPCRLHARSGGLALQERIQCRQARCGRADQDSGPGGGSSA
jgi:hypothetical protein